MRALLLLLLLGMAALAGCADDDGDATDDDSMDDGMDDDSMDDETTLPATLEFSTAPSLGCEGSIVGQGTCISFQGGPAASGLDGHWIELGPDYEGLQFTSTMTGVLGDSDCYLVADDGTTIIADGHNGGGLCAGTVPEGTQYLFIYSYVEPNAGMTVTFEA